MTDTHLQQALALLGNPDTNVALIGASRNTGKYGHIIMAWLLRRKKKVFPINPCCEEILGIQSLASVLDCQPLPDVMVFVTPPSTSLEILVSMGDFRPACIWLQSGSFDMEVLQEAKKRCEYLVDDACIMVAGHAL